MSSKVNEVNAFVKLGWLETDAAWRGNLIDWNGGSYV